MIITPIEPDFERIRTNHLIPRQRKTSRGFKISCDFRQQFLIKAPFLCEFHSYAEYLYAGLLEGNTQVISFVPQPFTLRVGKKNYTPDFYVERRGKKPIVIELKPKKTHVSSDRRDAINAYIDQSIGGSYRVISNKKVFKHRLRAENWLQICRRLHLGRFLQTEVLEQTLLNEVVNQPMATLGDLFTPGYATKNNVPFELEIATLRCLHQGLFQLNLDAEALNLNMRIYR